jgi:GDP-D-mannose dehydratase
MDLLFGDCSKARENLGRQTRTGPADLCWMMVEAEMQREQGETVRI